MAAPLDGNEPISSRQQAALTFILQGKLAVPAPERVTELRWGAEQKFRNDWVEPVKESD
jgi:hypothetical protein